MGPMPRTRPPYLHRYHTRHGKFIWYVRKPGGARLRIRGEYGAPEFDAAYRAAINGLDPPSPRKAATGSLTWLWERYREVGAWTALSPATRRQRENIMLHVLEAIGADPCGSVTRKEIVASRDRRAATPSQARNFLDAMRGLFRWALEAGHVAIDPTAGVKNPPKPPGDGFPPWTEDEIDRYQAYWPIGTKERVWIDVLLYTGLRRGDAVTLGRQHVRNGVAIIRTEKSRRKVTVTIPILPVLEATLRAGPCGELAFICGESRKPLTKESFGNVFREACREAGVEKSAHGIRKAGANRAADNGATNSEMKSLFGWQSEAMAGLYTKGADRARLARGAITKLERPICSPDQKAVPTANKS